MIHIYIFHPSPAPPHAPYLNYSDTLVGKIVVAHGFLIGLRPIRAFAICVLVCWVGQLPGIELRDSRGPRRYQAQTPHCYFARLATTCVCKGAIACLYGAEESDNKVGE